jgi:hypothetical protein
VAGAASFLETAATVGTLTFRPLAVGTGAAFRAVPAFRTRSVGRARTFGARAVKGTLAFRAAPGVFTAFAARFAFAASFAGAVGIRAKDRAVVAGVPACRGALGFGRGEDIELGLDGGRLVNGRYRRGRDFRDLFGDIFALGRNRLRSDVGSRRSRGGGLDRGSRSFSGSRSGYRVISSERVLVFALGSDELQSGGLICARGGGGSG